MGSMVIRYEQIGFRDGSLFLGDKWKARHVKLHEKARRYEFASRDSCINIIYIYLSYYIHIYIFPLFPRYVCTFQKEKFKIWFKYSRINFDRICFDVVLSIFKELEEVINFSFKPIFVTRCGNDVRHPFSREKEREKATRFREPVLQFISATCILHSFS